MEARTGGEDGRDKPNLRTAADAIKARAKIIDMVVDRGQELGVLPRAAQQKNSNVNVSGGILVGAMSDTELLESVRDLTEQRKKLEREYEKVPFAARPMPDIYGETPLVLDGETGEEVELVPVAPKIIRRKA
jgi:hypothetical protein